MNVVVSGSSRGLGLEFVRRWLAAGHSVFALARDPQASAALRSLEPKPGSSFRVQPCDVTDDESVRSAARAVGETWDRMDLLLNNAGISGERDRTIRDLDFAEARRCFEVNALGPLRVTGAFLDLLRRGSGPRLVHVTSLMGSIGDNTSGGSYAYRMSKAALNMASRNLAHELRPHGIASVAIHPGWVRTDMGGSDAPLSVEESVASMIRTIEGFTLEHTGRFFDLDGDELPW